MSRCWTFQDARQKSKLGDKCPWSVGWIDPDGKRKSKKIGAHSLADKYARKLEGQLAAGVYRDESRKLWSDFVTEYKASVLARTSAGNQESSGIALEHFQRLMKPGYVRAIKTATIDEYVAERRKESGRHGKSKVSVATINKELRHIRAALRVAHEWKYLLDVPKVRMLKEPVKLPQYMTAEDFAKIYEACDVARFPEGLPYEAGDWWKALLTFMYLTGWRVGEPLALSRDDVDLEAGTAITRHTDNKGKRDDVIPLHPVIVEHLAKIRGFDVEVFPWPHHRSTLWCEFERIQKAAGIHLPCHEDHEHTDRCHDYGFHDLRRAFATVNAETMTADSLQKLMRHRSYSTTQRYINLAGQLNRAVANLHVPDVLRTTGTSG